MDYYCVLADDSSYADRWFLGEPQKDDGIELDARAFRYGSPYSGAAPRVIPIGRDGFRTSFNLAAFDMPVVTSEIADIAKTLSPLDIERYPVLIDSDIQGYEILNIIGLERCVDEMRSRFRKWGPEDSRPDKIGQYRELAPLVIDPMLANGRHFLRIWGCLVELIVSEQVTELLSPIANLGVVFKRVS